MPVLICFPADPWTSLLVLGDNPVIVDILNLQSQAGVSLLLNVFCCKEFYIWHPLYRQDRLLEVMLHPRNRPADPCRLLTIAGYNAKFLSNASSFSDMTSQCLDPVIPHINLKLYVKYQAKLWYFYNNHTVLIYGYIQSCQQKPTLIRYLMTPTIIWMDESPIHS